MLVLSRKAGELIHIGDNVEVVVLGINGNRVRVGLTAPADVSIRRQEVTLRLARPAKIGAPVLSRFSSKTADRRPVSHGSNR
jgi:carbon storage regulator